MDKLLLLDSNSLINRAYYAVPNLTNRKGEPTGAIFGYVNMLLKLIENYKPTHIIATFDLKAPTFRKLMYADYKGTRKPMPDDLALQVQPLKDLLTAMKIPVVELAGYEADDIIGTLAKKWQCPTFIVTGDKDSLQLIDDTTTVLLTKKGISEVAVYDEAMLAGEGLKPSQIIDLKSLMGDSSDNIPGVGGVGEKTARGLLEKYQTLGGVYEHLDEQKGKLKERLETDKDKAYLSYKLATINVECPLEFNYDDAKLNLPFSQKVKEMFTQFEFSKLIDRLDFEEKNIIINKEEVFVKEITSISELQQVVAKIKDSGLMSIIIGEQIYLSSSQKDAYLISISDNFLGEGILYDTFMENMREVFESEDIKKIVFDKKIILHLLSEFNFKWQNINDDILLKAYLADATRTYKNAEELIFAYQLPQSAPTANMIAVNELLDKEMQEKELVELYQNIELPLVDVLFDMEQNGFKIDKTILHELNERFSAELDELSSEIVELAGKNFNINSPKQMASVLFEDLKLKGGKKTKSGYSTNVDVLNSLKDEHPIIPLLLRYRELSKLKSTYLDGIEPLIDSNGALHTVFKQTVTATGRLSSTEPNLQNIPIRKQEGKQIRRMFVASEGNTLVCADYSQIELRLMAAFSGDATMIESFKNNIDIHATTASQVFGVPLKDISADLRRQAKAVNFGIIYGISDYGLSEDIGVSVWQAKAFIERYFLKYPDVKIFMDKKIEEARANGYVSTIFKRRRYIPEITSSNYNLRSFGERVAMNMPLQGSASDIIKVAMINVYNALKKEGLHAKLIMQIHDELIIDTPKAETEKVKILLQQCMENVVNLEVKLVADCSVGDNWLEAK